MKLPATTSRTTPGVGLPLMVRAWLTVWGLFGCSCWFGCGAVPRGTVASAPATRAAATGPFSPGVADAARKAKLLAVAPALDQHFRSKLEQAGGTGLAVAIVLESELVYMRGFGVRDRASQAPIDSDTVFRIASLSKSFTALAVMKLRDEGKLGLDEPASKYFPPLASLALPTRDAPPITARLLLTNASGLAYDDLWGAVTYGRTDQQLLELLHAGVLFSAVPGTHYAYSNLGWALLGKVIEGASGAKVADYVTSAILRPLGMNATVWDPTAVPASRMAIGYHKQGADYVVDDRVPEGVFNPAGGLYTSLHDYARYIAYNLAAYPPRDEPESGPVRRSTLREMHEGQRRSRSTDKNAPIVRRTDDGIVLYAANYGFGWYNVVSCSGDTWVRHGGYEPGYFSSATLVPSRRVAIVTLATSAPVGSVASEQALQILRSAGIFAEIEPKPHPALLLAQTTIGQLLSGGDETTFSAMFDPDSLRYWWNRDLYGELSRLGARHGRCRVEGGLKAYDPLHAEWRLVCDKGAIVFDALMTPSVPTRVQALDWTEELPVDDASTEMARRLGSLIAEWDDAVAADAFAPDVELGHAKRSLARARLDHGACTLAPGSGVLERSRDAWFHDPGHLRFSVKCDQGSLELTFKVEEKTGKATELSLEPPRRADAVCWE